MCVHASHAQVPPAGCRNERGGVPTLRLPALRTYAVSVGWLVVLGVGSWWWWVLATLSGVFWVDVVTRGLHLTRITDWTIGSR